jgi:hypothetical protein
MKYTYEMIAVVIVGALAVGTSMILCADRAEALIWQQKSELMKQGIWPE